MADIVFPAASAYEKDGSVTNTAGEIQLLHKAAEVMGARSDFDLLRILSHQLERAGLGKAFHFKTPAAVFEEIRKAVPGYNVQPASLLTAARSPQRSSSPKTGTRRTTCLCNSFARQTTISSPAGHWAAFAP